MTACDCGAWAVGNGARGRLPGGQDRNGAVARWPSPVRAASLGDNEKGGGDGWIDRLRRRRLAGVTGGALALMLIGVALLTLGGWLGGTVVFVHGMRVVNEKNVPTPEAVKPDATGQGAEREKEERGGLTRY
jgi:hypothetical protein